MGAGGYTCWWCEDNGCRRCRGNPGEQGSTDTDLELDQLRDDWRVMRAALQNVLGTELLDNGARAAVEARDFARAALSKLRRVR